MSAPWSRTRWIALGAGLFALIAAYAFVARPWFRLWGATLEEARAELPGDRIVTRAREGDVVTRAITIDAPADRVWPWLAQLGQDRGGFYSYELLEDLAGCRMQNADRVHPDLGKWQPGDKLWMYPPDRLDGIGHALLVEYEPGRALGFATRRVGTPASAAYDGSWSFVLRPIDATTTRLVIRGRGEEPRSFALVVFDRLIFDPMHFVMERKMMETLKRRAEGASVSRASDVAEVVLFTLAFALFAAGAVLSLRRQRGWLRAFVVFVGAGAAFQLLPFGQPPLLFGLPLVLSLAALLVWRKPGAWRSFEARAAREASALRSVPPSAEPAATELDRIADPARRYLERALQSQAARVVRVLHGGRFRTSPQARWRAIRGEQQISSDPPGFVWWGRVRLAPAVFVDALDRSVQGHGSSTVALQSVLTLANASGRELDQSALARLLGELVLLPSALADARYVLWTPIDERYARATLRVGSLEVSAEFEFGEDGLPTGFRTERYRALGHGRAALTPFVGRYFDFRRAGPFLIPHRITGAWRLPDGDFEFADFSVEGVEYDAYDARPAARPACAAASRATPPESP